MPRTVAQALAERSDRIAATLRAGDECMADREADALRTAAISAVNAGRVPPSYQEELLANANELAERIVCRAPQAVEPTPTPVPPAAEEDVEEDEEDDEGRGKGKGNGRGRDKGEKPDRD